MSENETRAPGTGITTPTCREMQDSRIMALGEELRRMKAQRDDLLTACEGAIGYLTPCEGVAEFLSTEAHENVKRLLQAAITKAKA